MLCVAEACTLLVDLEHSFKIGLSIIMDYMYYYLDLNDIGSLLLNILVHALSDMRNNEAYNAFNSDVCHECVSHDMAIVIFIV